LPKLQQWGAKLRRSELEVSRHPLPFLAGAFYGALVIGLLWVFTAGSPPADSVGRAGPGGGAGAVGAPQDAGSAGSAGSAGPAGAASGSERLERCREVFTAQTTPLQAVPDPLSQWQVHIGAMNKLVTGVITLKQATQFWDQTRVGAAQGLARYGSSLDAFRQRTARCPRSHDETLTPDALRCTDAVAARARELTTAHTALSTWRMHVRHMEMLRKGEMSPARATRLWLASWHQGVRELADYRAAARRAAGRTC
jgi:hypothetical protein